MQATYKICTLVVLNMLLLGQTHINYMLTPPYTLQSAICALATEHDPSCGRLSRNMHATYATQS